MTKNLKSAFTLAEILITLGVIGVVAAVTMPTLVTNVQERVRKEQVRTVKYKFTKATDKMNSLGLIGHYNSTMDFVNELKKHLSIAKICDSDHLGECWGGGSFSNANGSKTYKVEELTSGKSLEALQFNSGDTDTVGIITGDGTPIILTYGKECQALDETKQYQWSTVNGKPETNATAGCVSMVFDINGKKGPNKLGTDVRTMNSLLGRVDLGSSYNALSKDECNNVKDKLGIQECGGVVEDRWAGAMKACDDLGLHLPSISTLARIASIEFGIEINIFDNIDFSDDCSTYKGDNICKILSSNDSYSSPLSQFWGNNYWANEAKTSDFAWARGFNIQNTSYARTHIRSGFGSCLCIAD